MNVTLLEAEACPDHIHILEEVLPHMRVLRFMGTLKSKSARMIFDQHAQMKYKYENRHFWARGYYVDTVGKNERIKQEYIQHQLSEELMMDQIRLKEFADPFTGKKIR